MPAGTRAQALQTRANSSGVVPVWACFTMVSALLSNSRATLRACVWERELIRARPGEGRKRAKERGVRFGRPRKMTPHQRQEALQRLAAGETMADVARTYAVDTATIPATEALERLVTEQRSRNPWLSVEKAWDEAMRQRPDLAARAIPRLAPTSVYPMPR